MITEVDETIDISKEEMKVIQNSDVLHKSDVKWIDSIEPSKELNAYEKEMLKGTKNAQQIIEEEKNETNPEYTEEEKLKIYKKDRIMKVKVISLDDMDKHPLANPSYFTKKEKDELIKLMEMNLNIPDDKLTEKFNQICIDKLFTEKSDYTTYPVYKNLV